MVYHIIKYATYREIFVLVQNGQVLHNLNFTAETHNSNCSRRMTRELNRKSLRYFDKKYAFCPEPNLELFQVQIRTDLYFSNILYGHTS